jgi:hypothetical protein
MVRADNAVTTFFVIFFTSGILMMPYTYIHRKRGRHVTEFRKIFLQALDPIKYMYSGMLRQSEVDDGLDGSDPYTQKRTYV